VLSKIERHEPIPQSQSVERKVYKNRKQNEMKSIVQHLREEKT
jgi:hypothetical protein